jgi:hypothetical protein
VVISILKKGMGRGAKKRVTKSYAGFQGVKLDFIELVGYNEKKGREDGTYSQATFIESACSRCAQ